MAPAPRSAAQTWRHALGQWAVPEAIMAAAPAFPWAFPPAVFARRAELVRAERSDRPSCRRALEALPDGGSVLDVGVGGGAASLPLVPPAGLLVGVDDGPGMLEVFAGAAEQLGVAHREVEGTWPDVAPRVDAADVVVCHNVLYNVPDVVPFLAALTDHARRRVAVEVTAEHPTAPMRPLWAAIHGIERPTSPTADDLLAVLAEMGLDVGAEPFGRPYRPLGDDRAETVAMVRRRLCVGPDRDAEIEALLEAAAADDPVRRSVAIWWDTPFPSK